jgi:GNAT superfamily N-acetyltransferase
VLGAWRGERLLGSIGCERDRRRKGRHVGHIVGMMVRPEARGRGIGRVLLQGLIGEQPQWGRAGRGLFDHARRML